MEMKRAGEIMLPLEAFPFVPYWFTLRQALAELGSIETSRDSARKMLWIILVFNAQSQFLGIVQRQDILRGLRPSTGDKIRGIYPPFASEPADPLLSRLSFSPESAVQELRNQIERQIIEFMTPIQISVNFSDPALLAVHLMIDRDLTFVPVVRDGTVVGILNVEDALNEVIASII
ncbi:MAG: CBS domain-containing protein [Chitinivibrionia bacterium]|nr:CBS domain-containing protein [Chitinivibrionia bacterium]